MERQCQPQAEKVQQSSAGCATSTNFFSRLLPPPSREGTRDRFEGCPPRSPPGEVGSVGFLNHSSAFLQFPSLILVIRMGFGRPQHVLRGSAVCLESIFNVRRKEGTQNSLKTRSGYQKTAKIIR